MEIRVVAALWLATLASECSMLVGMKARTGLSRQLGPAAHGIDSSIDKSGEPLSRFR